KLSDPIVNTGGRCRSVRVAVSVCARGGLESFGDFGERRVRKVGWRGWRWKREAASCFSHKLGHADRVQVQVVEQPAFVINRFNGEFKPLSHKSSHYFQWRVCRQLDQNFVGLYFDRLFKKIAIVSRG